MAVTVGSARIDERGIDEEIWKPVNGYEGRYEISSQGRIKRIKRICQSGRTVSEKYMSLRLCSVTGYWRVNLRNQYGRKTIDIHRLLAEAFIPNPENKKYVNHIDGNKKNCHLSNLEWVTQKENVDHALSSGLMKQIPPYSLRGESNPKHKLTEEDVSLIRSLYDTGEYRLIDLAEMFGVHKCTIWDIKSNRTWMKGSGIFGC